MGTRKGTWADAVREWESAPVTAPLPENWRPHVRLTTAGEGWAVAQREWDEAAYDVTAVLP